MLRGFIGERMSEVISPAEAQYINELTLHQDQWWSSQGLEKLHLMKRDYSLKIKLFHFPALPSALLYSDVFLFSALPTFLKKTHSQTCIQIIHTLTKLAQVSSLDQNKCIFVFYLYFISPLICFYPIETRFHWWPVALKFTVKRSQTLMLW